MEEDIGTVITSDGSQSQRAISDVRLVDDKLILTIIINYPKARFAPGDTVVIRNETG